MAINLLQVHNISQDQAFVNVLELSEMKYTSDDA